MYCPKCGTQNPDDAKFCRECRNLLQVKKSKTPIYIAAGISVLAILIVILVLNKKDFGEKQATENVIELNDVDSKNDSLKPVISPEVVPAITKDSSEAKKTPAKIDNVAKTIKKEVVPNQKVEPQTGYFTDSRDGKKYKWVQIGDQVWMAENLAYMPRDGNFWAYKNDESNALKYGYLYDWKTAKTIAPVGWHLPTRADWDLLLKYFVDDEGEYNAYYSQSKLVKGGDSGFEVLFAGSCFEDKFNNIGTEAYFWCETKYDEECAWRITFRTDDCWPDEPIDIGYGGITCGMSVRLIKDE